MSNGCIYPQEFAQFLDEQLPIYDQEIIRDMRPTDGWIGHVSVGQWDPQDGVQHTRDRFRQVMPDVTKAWTEVSNTACIGGNQAPCDPQENFIGWGYDRITYGQERQSWRSQLLCFDQILTVNKAEEHLSQIISDILRPSTSRIASFYLRKKAAQLAGKKWLANSLLSDFTFAWELNGGSEQFITTNGEPTSKLTPQMLQRRVAPLRNIGYFGKWTNDPFFGGYSSMIELCTDDDTCWELDKVASDSRISDQWRFQTWDAGHEYYKYGMGGQLGNYMVRIDPFPLRFNKVSNNRFQVVLPYTNVAAFQGIGSQDNPDFHKAQYQFSIIHHRMAMRLKVQRMASINSLMPFAVRDLAGSWRFATNDLGQDCNGNPIANYRGNKGFFYADFQYSAEPVHVEWEELIFHKREPAVVYVVETCAPDPGYPTQTYNSANDKCENDIIIYPTQNASGAYAVAANTITCDGNPTNNTAKNATSIDDLAAALNADAATSALGQWEASGNRLILLDTSCKDVTIPFLP